MNCINVWFFCQASPEGTRVTVQNSLPYMFSISPFQDHWPKWQSWMPESGANMSDTNAVIYVQNCVQHCGVGTVHTLCFPWFVKQNYTDTICIPRCTSEPCFSMNNSHRCNWSEGGRKTRVNWIIQCWTIAIAAATLNFRLCCQLANYLDSRLYSLQGDIYKKKQDGIDVSSFFLRLQRTNFFSLSSCVALDRMSYILWRGTKIGYTASTSSIPERILVLLRDSSNSRDTTASFGFSLVAGESVALF